MKISLNGNWTVSTSEVQNIPVLLPGSLDTNKTGHSDKVAKPWHPDVAERNKNMDDDLASDPRINSRFTRKYTYEGFATFNRNFDQEVSPEKRYFLVAERSRALTLTVDDVPMQKLRGTLSTPYVFEVTGYLHKGSLIKLTSDNSYPDLPYSDILFSSAATDETQTNWNGIIGEIYVVEKERSFISDVRVYPVGDSIDAVIDILADSAFSKESYTILIEGDCLNETLRIEKDLSSDHTETLKNIPLTKEALSKNWDEYEGNTFEIKVSLFSGKKLLSEKTISFGIRDFSAASGKLTLNSRTLFVRSEANCAIFPETGFPPMDKSSWLSILKTYASYGVNLMRFHSWCPPKAAFEAADELGILMQPELSNWNPRTAFGSKESRKYYEEELREILLTYANHPSFVMLSLGNELITDGNGVAFEHHLLSVAKETDRTRLYAWGSNNFYGEKGCDKESDFYTSAAYLDAPLRLSGVEGIYNTSYPGSSKDFREVMKDIRKEYAGPVISFEVGQYEVLPDMDELTEFRGVTRPDNLQIVKDKLEKLGVSDNDWKKRVSATGEMSLLAYREEVEAVMRTPEMSGISLLGLQDFPGQGTALIGMMNSHLSQKPFDFAAPKRFKKFFSDSAILVLLDRYTYKDGEKLTGRIKIANYGKHDITGKVSYSLVRNDDHSVAGIGSLEDVSAPYGNLTEAGSFEIVLEGFEKSTRLNLIIRIDGTDISNTYPIWVYPDRAPLCPASVFETDSFDEKAIDILKEGGDVFLTPPSTKEALPNSAKAQFSTDFWSVGTFPSQEGCMGQLIDKDHPIFKSFPTEEYSNYQWWPMASQRAIILPKYMDTIISEMDSYATLRPMTMLMEANCENGRLLISSMGLKELIRYPEASALLSSIYEYMVSKDFNPKDTMSAKEVRALFAKH